MRKFNLLHYKSSVGKAVKEVLSSLPLFTLTTVKLQGVRAVKLSSPMFTPFSPLYVLAIV